MDAWFLDLRTSLKGCGTVTPQGGDVVVQDCETNRCNRRHPQLLIHGSCKFFLILSFLRLAKKDSATALSQQLPFRVMLGVDFNILRQLFQ